MGSVTLFRKLLVTVLLTEQHSGILPRLLGTDKHGVVLVMRMSFLVTVRFEVDLHWDPDEDEGRLRDDVRARHMGYPAPGADPAGGNPHNQSQNLHYQTPYPGRQPSQDSYNQAQHTVYHPVPGAYPIGSNFYSSTHEYQTPYPRGQPNQDNIHLQHLGFSILGVNPGDRIQSSNRQYQINVHSPGYIIVGTYIAYAEHSCARMHDSQYQGQYPGVSTHNQEGQVHCCGAHRALEALLTPSGLERHLHGGLYSRMQTQNPDGIPTASGGQYPAPQTGIPTASSGQYQAPQSQAQVAQGLNQVSGQTPQQGSRSQYPSWTPRYQDLQGQNAARPNQGYQGPQLQRQAPGPQDLQSQTQRSQISNPRGQMTQSRPMTNQNDSRPRGSLITPPQGPIPAPLPASHDHTVPGSLSPQTQQHSRAQQTPQGGTIPKTYEFQTAQIAQQEAGPGALFFVGHGGTVHHMIAETRAGGIQGATVRQPQVQAPQTQDGATSRSAASQMPGQASQGVTITQAQRPQAQAGGQVGAASISASQIPGQAPQGATIPQAQGTTQAGQGGTSASASPDPAPEAEQAMRPEYQIKRVPRGSQAPIGTSGFQTPQGGTIPSTAGLHASQAPGATSQGPANQGDGHAHFSSGHQVPYGWATSGSQKRTAPPGEGHAQCCGAHQVPHGWATSGSQERTAPPGESQPTQQQQGANPEREQQPSQGSPWWVGRWDQFPEHIRRNVIEDFFHENNSN